MTNDVGPFQDIIEVGWGDPLPDTDSGWQIEKLPPSGSFGAEFQGGSLSWNITLRLTHNSRTDDPQPWVSVDATRFVQSSTLRNVSVTWSVINAPGDATPNFLVIEAGGDWQSYVFVKNLSSPPDLRAQNSGNAQLTLLPGNWFFRAYLEHPNLISFAPPANAELVVSFELTT